MDGETPEQRVQTALEAVIRPGEVIVGWIATIEVVRPDGGRYLAHRAGGGHDGSNAPMMWTAVGMAQAMLDTARQQVAESTVDVDDHPDDGA